MSFQRADNFWSRVYQFALRPYSRDPDTRRREFILNVLLSGLISISFLALCASIITSLAKENTLGLQPLAMTATFLLVVTVCWRAVRAGYSRIVSYGLVIGLSFLATQLMGEWSFELPQVLLTYVLTIVMAGILLGARQGLWFAGISIVLIISGGYTQINHYLHPNTNWQDKPFILIDALGYAFVFGLIGLVSWLSNREIDRSLRRARQSEAALLKERDNLEVKVQERTRELEQSQLVRLMELQRFAAFGRLSAGLVHELANPLAAATINLERLGSKANNEPLQHIHQNLQHLERYLAAARKQLQNNSTVTTFSLTAEFKHLASLVQSVAQKNHVRLEMPKSTRLTLYGDPIKFNQLVSNLLINAIEAYPPGSLDEKRVVKLEVNQLKQGASITVSDWGSGITSEQMEHIFEPFYSHKPAATAHTSLGIGLALVKQFIEEDFGGTLTVSSNKVEGTRFTATLLGAKRKNHKNNAS